MVLTPEERRERNRLAVQRFRSRQTPVNLDEERCRNRERQRERRREQWSRASKHQPASILTPLTRPSVQNPTPAAAPNAPPATSPLHGWGDDEVPRLRPVSAATKEAALHRLRLALGAHGLDEVTCAVCDSRNLRSSCQIVQLSDTRRIEHMRILLPNNVDGLPAELIADYDCSDVSDALAGMLLSRRGVRHDGSLNVCDECNTSLLKQVLPKFSIKNGFFIGDLPSCFNGITLPERAMTQLVSVVAVTRVMRGGSHRSIRSHCLAFDCTPGPPATLLPIPVGEVTSYRVVLAGPFTTEQQARARKMHHVRRQVVSDLLRFYHQYNPMYKSIDIDCTKLPDDGVPENVIFDVPDADVEVNEMDAEHDRVGGVSENNSTSNETEVIER